MKIEKNEKSTMRRPFTFTYLSFHIKFVPPPAIFPLSVFTASNSMKFYVRMTTKFYRGECVDTFCYAKEKPKRNSDGRIEKSFLLTWTFRRSIATSVRSSLLTEIGFCSFTPTEENFSSSSGSRKKLRNFTFRHRFFSLIDLAASLPSK